MEPQQKRTSLTAIGSLVFGVASLAMGFVAGIPAIVTGHLARQRIRRSNGMLVGQGAALAGLLLGYAMSLISVAVLVAVVAGARSGVERARNEKGLRQAVDLKSAVDAYAAEYERLPDPGTGDFTTMDPAGQALLRALIGCGRSARGSDNPRAVRFLSLPERRDRCSGIILGPDGIPNGMTDPWGNPYRVVLNSIAAVPMRFRYGSRMVETYGRDVVVASRGKDGVEGTDDDLKTWE